VERRRVGEEAQVVERAGLGNAVVKVARVTQRGGNASPGLRLARSE